MQNKEITIISCLLQQLCCNNNNIVIVTRIVMVRIDELPLNIE